MKDSDYVQIMTDYAQGVVAGEVLACEWVQLACKRFLSDCDREGDPSFPFHLDRGSVDAVCGFLERMPHIKGVKWAGQLLTLQPWQVFIVGNVWGWRNKDTGRRRFRKSYIEVPRGNGKSFLSSGLALYALAADGEPGAEVYSAATTRDQAKIIFGDAASMAQKSPAFRRKFGVLVREHQISQPATFSKFRALASDSHEQLDGLNPSLALIDELHAHSTRKVHDVLETGSVKRAGGLIWIITTAGSDQSGICFEVRSYITKILRGLIQDHSVFGVIYTIDQGDPNRAIIGDNAFDESSWRKANPNYGISVQPEIFKQLAQQAKTIASAKNSFLVKHLNVWTLSNMAWFDMQKYNACYDPELTIEKVKHLPCVGGLDLSEKRDFTAGVRIFFEGEGNERQYYCIPFFMLPEETVRSSTNAALAGWVADGYVRATDGKVINFDLVEEEVTRWKDECEDLREVAFDPWHGSALSQHLIDAGVNMIEVRAIIRDMSGPTKTLDAIIRDERFHHDGNPCLAWMFSNVVAHYDAKSNVYPRRERENDPNCKIDGAIASIMAMSRLELLAADDGTVLMSVPAWRNFPDGHGGMDVKCIGNNGAFWSSDGAKAD